MSNATVEEQVKNAGILHMSGEEYMSPELIEDAIQGTIEVHNGINLSELVEQIEGDYHASGESR